LPLQGNNRCRLPLSYLRLEAAQRLHGACLCALLGIWLGFPYFKRRSVYARIRNHVGMLNDIRLMYRPVF